MKQEIKFLWVLLAILFVIASLISCDNAEENFDNSEYSDYFFQDYVSEDVESCSHQFTEKSDCDFYSKTCTKCGYVADYYSVDNHDYFGGICNICNAKQGTWQIRYYNDIFGNETYDPYIDCEYIVDNDWDLEKNENDLLTITLEDDNLLLKLYDAYTAVSQDFPEEEFISLCRWFDGDKFNISILDENGNEYYGTGVFSEVYDAIIPNDSTLFNCLRSNQSVKLHILYQEAQSKAGYLFTINTDNFSDVYNAYHGLKGRAKAY